MARGGSTAVAMPAGVVLPTQCPPPPPAAAARRQRCHRPSRFPPRPPSFQAGGCAAAVVLPTRCLPPLLAAAARRQRCHRPPRFPPRLPSFQAGDYAAAALPPPPPLPRYCRRPAAAACHCHPASTLPLSPLRCHRVLPPLPCCRAATAAVTAAVDALPQQYHRSIVSKVHDSQ